MTHDDPFKNLKSSFGEENPIISDQRAGKKAPPVEKPINENEKIIPLISENKISLKELNIYECFKKRKSIRSFTNESISFEELSFLLWATQGVRHELRSSSTGEINALFKSTPSAGARNPFDTYLLIKNVEGLSPGLYRFTALKKGLLFIAEDDYSGSKLKEAVNGQTFCAEAPVIFVWVATPYRTEWRYGVERSIKVILLDAGHIGQNLHLACDALNLGTCMIAAYNQNLIDEILKIDGTQELAVYLAPVGVPSVKN